MSPALRLATWRMLSTSYGPLWQWGEKECLPLPEHQLSSASGTGAKCLPSPLASCPDLLLLYFCLQVASAVEKWKTSIREAQTFSRMHVLLGMLDACIKWDMSAENARCKVCRKKGACLFRPWRGELMPPSPRGGVQRESVLTEAKKSCERSVSVAFPKLCSH